MLNSNINMKTQVPHFIKYVVAGVIGAAAIAAYVLWNPQESYTGQVVGYFDYSVNAPEGRYTGMNEYPGGFTVKLDGDPVPRSVLNHPIVCLDDLDTAKEAFHAGRKIKIPADKVNFSFTALDGTVTRSYPGLQLRGCPELLEERVTVSPSF